MVLHRQVGKSLFISPVSGMGSRERRQLERKLWPLQGTLQKPPEMADDMYSDGPVGVSLDPYL